MSNNYLKFDPSLDIPEGLEGATVIEVDEEASPVAPALDDDSLYIYDDGEDDGPSDDTPDPDEGLDTPTEMVILGQTIRTAPGGNQVVDVVIEVDEVPGATDYELRVTKA